MVKKLLTLLLVVILGLSFSSTSSADTFSEKEAYQKELSNLSAEEIRANFERIDEEYEIGEAFSVKDQTFIEMYASPVNKGEFTTLASKKISASKTVNGIKVTVNGTIKDDIQNLVNQSFSGDLKTRTTKGASKVSSVKTTVHHTAYGLVGSGGIGKVYSGTISASGKNNNLNSKKRYSAIVAYASTWCTVTVEHSGGTFTINPK
ncbi:hypothetical protein MM221_10395 [Salipaludibacillus sp. LMS25]|jgi:hypothetical protein|uniref:hypothetical protein n=1 Tax=Salipaludibacillus sp. LMS25 TaxID=2924031 RepID=UPI0020D00BEE|nr:hypothetical protein [Salipaludibacillus sp. LMS25]UTR16878.1 hypothetical protein MM221_10395 [Salipaludibacillus sp. LMS25]